jgi:hypothetical protein
VQPAKSLRTRRDTNISQRSLPFRRWTACSE